MALHCSATVLIVSPPEHEAGVAALVAHLADSRIAEVYASRTFAEPAHLIADRLGCPVGLLQVELEGPRDAALEEIADLHRGEQVVVLVRRATHTTDQIVAVEIGDDGWTVREVDL